MWLCDSVGATTARTATKPSPSSSSSAFPSRAPTISPVLRTKSAGFLSADDDLYSFFWSSTSSGQILGVLLLLFVCLSVCLFLQPYCPNGISPMSEIRVAFPRESQLRQSRATQPKVHAECFSVSTSHRPLTRTAGSLTCTQMQNACDCTRGCTEQNKRSALGEKNLAAPGNRTCVGGVPVRCTTNCATSRNQQSLLLFNAQLHYQAIKHDVRLAGIFSCVHFSGSPNSKSAA